MKLSKILSLVLAFVMIFSVLPIAVFAEDEELSIYDVVDNFPDKDDPVVQLYDEYADGATYQWSRFDIDIEGETSPELSAELDFCADYTCTITLSNGEIFEVSFDTFPCEYSNPTVYNPTFHVSDTDKLSGYQWYAHVVTDTAITDKNASDFCSTCENKIYSSYDEATNLWSGTVVGGDGEGMFELFMFEVELNEGDMLLIDAGYEVEAIIISDSDNDIMTNPDYFLVGNIGVYSAPEKDTYKITVYTPDRDSTVSAYIRTYEKDVKLDDETDNTLSEFDLGNAYYCIATYDNLYTLESAAFLAAPIIEGEPDSLSRTFEVTYSEFAKFQWYQVKESATPITDENASRIQYGPYKSSYNGADGVWNGLMTYLSEDWVEFSFFEIYLKEGDIVKFKTDADLDGGSIYMQDYDNDISQSCYLENGEYKLEVKYSGTYTVLYGAINDENAGKLYAELIKTQTIKLEGENTDTLSEAQIGQKYFCEAAYTNCMVLESETLKIVPEILEEPTAQKPEITVTYQDEAKFQWYTATPQTIVVDDTMVDYAYGTYDSETQQWTPECEDPYDYAGYQEYEMDLFEIELKKGDVLKVTISNTDAISPADSHLRINGVMSNYLDWNGTDYIEFTVPENDTYHIYQFGKYPETATFKFELVNYVFEEIEGETEKQLSVFERDTLYAVTASYTDGTVLTSNVFEVYPAIISQPTDKNPSVEVNIVEDDMKYQWYNVVVGESIVTDKDVELTNEDTPATYDSETQEWTPTIYDVYEFDDYTKYELDLFIMELEKGEMLTFTPSVALLNDRIIAIQRSNDDDLYISANEDGTYTFVSPETQEYYFYFYADTADITVKVEKVGFIIGDAIEGETDKKLKNRKTGSYACVITYEDGTELVSDFITITTIVGDINSDGKVDSLDYLLVKRACFKTYELDEVQTIAADINGDDDINSTDYLLVKRIAFGTYTA